MDEREQSQQSQNAYDKEQTDPAGEYGLTMLELRNLYGIAYKCLQRERVMRVQHLPPGPAAQRKLEEIDRAMAAITRWKDWSKHHVIDPEAEPPPEYQQPALFPQPAGRGY